VPLTTVLAATLVGRARGGDHPLPAPPEHQSEPAVEPGGEDAPPGGEGRGVRRPARWDDFAPDPDGGLDR
jgi:hypothetical protein